MADAELEIEYIAVEFEMSGIDEWRKLDAVHSFPSLLQ